MQTNKVFLWSLTVALGGFLFGFDTAVISGAEKAIQQLWQLNETEHGFTVAIAIIGTALGAIFGGLPSDQFGRKWTLFSVAILYLLASVGTALAADWYTFLFFRFLGGVGVGASSVTAPLYISEIAPAKSRGKLVGLFQFNIVFGILVAYLSNYVFSLLGGGENDWRWMLGVQAFPSLFFMVAVLFIPESPRWLIVKRNKMEEAKKTLLISNPGSDVNEMVADILLSAQQSSSQAVKPSLFSKQYRKPVMLAVVFAFFNQVSGINAIIYYAPRIFEEAGLGKSSALLSSAGIGLINFIFTLLAVNLIDRFGRRKLMLIGSFGLIATLGLVAKAFYLGETGFSVPIYLFIYIAFFAFSQGAVIWVFLSEIFPNQVRAYGQALGSSTHWVMAAIISFSFPYISKRFGEDQTFLFFTVMMVLQLIFVWRVMPETKGTSLERVERDFIAH